MGGGGTGGSSGKKSKSREHDDHSMDLLDDTFAISDIDDNYSGHWAELAADHRRHGEPRSRHGSKSSKHGSDSHGRSEKARAGKALGCSCDRIRRGDGLHQHTAVLGLGWLVRDRWMI